MSPDPRKDLIVFDMDGVLVEVTESYRATIQATVLHFTGDEPTRAEIQAWKNRGGFNDDWNLSHQMIHARGGNTAYNDVVEYFQHLFHGDAQTPGMILRERWISSPGLLERLAGAHTLAVFTGRLRWEAQLTLDRFTQVPFAPIVGVDDVVTPKPNPEGLLKIKATVPHNKIWYVGDTIDDAKAGVAAGVPFIGIAKHPVEIELLKQHGALHIFEDINQMEAILG